MTADLKNFSPTGSALNNVPTRSNSLLIHRDSLYRDNLLRVRQQISRLLSLHPLASACKRDLQPETPQTMISIRLPHPRLLVDNKHRTPSWNPFVAAYHRTRLPEKLQRRMEALSFVSDSAVLYGAATAAVGLLGFIPIVNIAMVMGLGLLVGRPICIFSWSLLLPPCSAIRFPRKLAYYRLEGEQGSSITIRKELCRLQSSSPKPTRVVVAGCIKGPRLTVGVLENGGVAAKVPVVVLESVDLESAKRFNLGEIGGYDAVVLLDRFEQIRIPETFLQEVASSLKSDGVFIFIEKDATIIDRLKAVNLFAEIETDVALEGQDDHFVGIAKKTDRRSSTNTRNKTGFATG